MANVRLLRQSIDDYQKDTDTENANYGAAYDKYSKDFEVAKAQVDAYNAQVAAKNAQGVYANHINQDPHTHALVYWYYTGNKDDVRGSPTPPIVLGAKPVVPDAPATPTPVQAPNITASNARELMNPGQNQAGLDLQAAKGIIGKSELTGDQQPAMRGSVFAKQDDPQGLKERGVLARVLGGQL